MCELGTCRPCRKEERDLDRLMGTAREYISPTLPSREENAEKRKVIGLSMVPNASATSRSNEAKQKKVYLSRAERLKLQAQTRKEERELDEDGNLVSMNAPYHGSPSIYVNWHCRCDPCSAAYSDRRKERPA